MNQEEYDAAVKKHREELFDLQKNMKQKSQEFFKEGSKLLFDRFPELESFSWRQYTPYFNDGDPCYFRVRAYSESVGVNDCDGEEWARQKEDEGKTEDEAWEIPQAISNFVEGFDEDALEEIFGDHAKITVYRDGETEINEYSHD